MPAIERLGHVGIHVHDLDVATSFYRDVLGLTVTDTDDDLGMVFLSARPDVEHHELLLCRGRVATRDDLLVQQISFRCPSLEDIRAFHERLVSHGVEIDMVVSHGNAIGIYFFDPDHNRCEVYWGTGLVAKQPYLEHVDLHRPPAEIMAELEASVAEHGEHGRIEQEFLERQDLSSS
jgi:catechol 2,3-dioxygenase-like lactoylglutathione lyase family enzyme